jgi:antitoxin component YwqK of YwqJK toxin-antitoxin module
MMSSNLMCYKVIDNYLITLDVPCDATTNINRDSCVDKFNAKHMTNKCKIADIYDINRQTHRHKVGVMSWTGMLHNIVTKGKTCMDKRYYNHIFKLNEVKEFKPFDPHSETDEDIGISFYLDKICAINNSKFNNFIEFCQQDGIGIFYDDNGAIKHRKIFKNNTYIGLISAGEYKIINYEKLEERVECNKIDGEVTMYFENGDVKSKSEWCDNKLNGKWIDYYCNDKVKSKGSYMNGMLDGVWYYYDVLGIYKKLTFFGETEHVCCICQSNIVENVVLPQSMYNGILQGTLCRFASTNQEKTKHYFICLDCKKRNRECFYGNVLYRFPQKIKELEYYEILSIKLIHCKIEASRQVCDYDISSTFL